MGVGEMTAGADEHGLGVRDVAVLSMTYELRGLFEGQAPVGLVSEPGDDAGTAAVLAQLREALAGSRRVVVIHPDWIADEALRRLQTARALADTHRVALVASDLPPLAGGVLAALAAALAPHLDEAGRLVGALAQVAAELVVVSWVGSVAGLRRPAPSMLQHARSVLPVRGFGVGVQPEEFVRRIDPRRPEVPLARVDRAMELVVADHGGDVDWVIDVVNPALGRLRLGQVDASPRASAWWGTSKLVEAVAYPTELRELAERTARPLALHACEWCGAGTATAQCAFCGHMVGRRRAEDRE